MSGQKETNYRSGKGTEWSSREAATERRLVRAAEDLFELWGYRPTRLPLLDLYDSYSEVLNNRAHEQLYRLIDRDGDLLLLRSDSTLFLARSVAPLIESGPVPIRLYYADAIVRHQKSEDPLHNEFFQIGAELMGRAGHRGEVEVAALICTLAQTIGVENAVLHLGTRALFNSIFEKNDPEVREDAATMILRREWDLLRKIAGPVTDIFSFIGTIDDFEKQRKSLESRLASEGAKRAINDLFLVTKSLTSIDNALEVRVDFSEIGIQPYYTGCVLGLYLEGIPTAIAAGGRYDKLLEKFGHRYPSVGFSLMLSKIIGSVEQYRFRDPVVVEEQDVVSAMNRATEIRSRGECATL